MEFNKHVKEPEVTETLLLNLAVVILKATPVSKRAKNGRRERETMDDGKD